MKRALLTKHAMEHLQQRHDKWLLPYRDEESFRYSCLELFNGRAVESNRHINDTALMLRLREQYGYDHDYTFRVYENALFVIVDSSCVTVLDMDIHTYSRQFNPRAPAPTGRMGKTKHLNNRVSRTIAHGAVERSQRHLENAERRSRTGDYE